MVPGARKSTLCVCVCVCVCVCAPCPWLRGEFESCHAVINTLVGDWSSSFPGPPSRMAVMVIAVAVLEVCVCLVVFDGGGSRDAGRSQSRIREVCVAEDRTFVELDWRGGGWN
ncbi:hypothetical protein LZ31DRAFT_303533 [Colletotrichum somersetense]|nr:hypothetical protein LZ31DRAFT_303533 [Colletotrichum somersetense]